MSVVVNTSVSGGGGGGGGSSTFAGLSDATTANIPSLNTPTASALALKAPINNPVFTGDPQAPTPATTDNDTSIATTAYVQNVFATSSVLSSLNLLPLNNEAVLPSQSGAATWATIGTTAPIVVGTATVQTYNTTSIQFREVAYNYATLTATAGLKSGVNFVTKRYVPSSSISGPDMKLEIKAMVTDTTSGCRGFIGLGTGSAPNIDAGNPSTRNSLTGLWHDDTDTVWQLGVTTSSGVATKIATTIPVSTLNQKLWVKFRYRGFPTNTIQIDVWNNDAFVQSATFTYAQAAPVGAYGAYAYRANSANATITSISTYGYVADNFSTFGDTTTATGGTQPFTTITYSTTPTITYVNGANYDLTLSASTIASWTEVGLTSGVSWTMVVRQDGTGGWSVPAWPTSWAFQSPGGAGPTIPVTATTGYTVLAGVYHPTLAKTLVSFVQQS